MLIQCAKSCFEQQKAATQAAQEVAAVDSFFSLSAKDIDGNVIPFETLRGQVTVLTNVASYCGFTESHYRSLVELYAATAGKPVTILAFVSTVVIRDGRDGNPTEHVSHIVILFL